MPRLSDIDRAKILADYHVGLSQCQLSIKYEVSPATINKLCKGLERKHVENVNTLTRMAIDLAKESEFQVNAIAKEVNERTQDMEFFRHASLMISKKALAKLKDDEISMADIERAQSVIGKGKENIYGKSPETAVQINNSNSKTTYGWED